MGCCDAGGEIDKGCDQLKPDQTARAAAPFVRLCDNESFLNAADCSEEYRKLNILLWKVPPKSPDLNPIEWPIERFWAYLRKRLRALDLKDALAKKPLLGKMAYKARVLSVISSVAAQNVAKNIAAGYLKVCREVVRKKGAASSGWLHTSHLTVHLSQLWGRKSFTHKQLAMLMGQKYALTGKMLRFMSFLTLQTLPQNPFCQSISKMWRSDFHTEKLLKYNIFKTGWKSDRAVPATQNTLPNAIRNRPYVWCLKHAKKRKLHSFWCMSVIAF